MDWIGYNDKLMALIDCNPIVPAQCQVSYVDPVFQMMVGQKIPHRTHPQFPVSDHRSVKFLQWNIIIQCYK